METGLKDVARIYYEKASSTEKSLAYLDFKTLDSDGDGRIDIKDLERYMTTNSQNLLKLSQNSDGTLNFKEFLAIHYAIYKVKMLLRCDCCTDFIVGPYYSCLLCLRKGSDSYDVCCACIDANKMVHEHSFNNFRDAYSMTKMLRERFVVDSQQSGKDANKSAISKREMEMKELHAIAQSHYESSSQKDKDLAQEFFKALDISSDGQVNLQEFLAFMKKQRYVHLQNRSFFSELDTDQSGTLDFRKAMTLRYIITSGRPICDCCGLLVPGIYFSCVDCFKSIPKNMFHICYDCYSSKACTHQHNGQVQFIDNYTMLEAKNDSKIAQEATLKP